MFDSVNTFRGVTIPVEKMSHQHISNWIHYARHVMESDQHEKYFLDVLEKRFGGKLLMYQPQSDYLFEIEQLKKKGMIEEGTGKVFHNGKQIGQVV